MVGGIILVAAASPQVAERLGYESFRFLKLHLIYLVIAVTGMIFMSLCSITWIRRLSILGFVGAFVASLIAALFGAEINGAQRWLSIAGISVQPSEFLKPSLAITLAWLLAHGRLNPHFPTYRLALAIATASLGVLVLQPDIGTTFLTAIMSLSVFLTAGMPLSILMILFIIGVSALGGAYLFLPHVTSRINRFLDPSSGDTFQIDRSLMAFENGGLLGTGPGQGDVKLTLPDAHADFIFAVAGEEFGLIMTILIVMAFSTVVIYGFHKLKAHKDLFIVYASCGLLTLIGLQAIIHMLTSLNFIPTKGMTLPFLSYGGSSLVATGYMAGSLLGLTRHRG